MRADLLQFQVAAHGGVLSYKFGSVYYNGYGAASIAQKHSVDVVLQICSLQHTRRPVLHPGSCMITSAFVLHSNAYYQREWDTYNPLTVPTDPSLACNTNGAVLAKQLSATVSGMYRNK